MPTKTTSQPLASGMSSQSSATTNSTAHHSQQITNHREVCLARYHAAHVNSLPGADQVDFELFPQTRNQQAVPDYSYEIYDYLRRQESANPSLFTQKQPQDI
jgi:hypothetical protein